MRYKAGIFKLAALLTAFLLAFFVFAGCGKKNSNVTPDNGGGNQQGGETTDKDEGDNEGEIAFEDMTTQQRFEAMQAAIAASYGNYSLTAHIENNNSSKIMDCSMNIADGKMIAENISKNENDTTNITSYGLRQGGYFYEKFTMGDYSSVLVTYGEILYENLVGFIDQMLSSLLRALPVKDFYGLAIKNSTVGEESVSFSFAEYAYDVPSGTIVPEKNGCKVEFIFRDLLSTSINLNNKIYNISVDIARLGGNEVTLPVSEAEMTEGISDYDRAYAEIEAAFSADTAKVDVVFTDYTFKSIEAVFSDGEMLCNAVIPGGTATDMRLASIRRDGMFVYAGDPPAKSVGMQPLSENGSDVAWALKALLGISSISEDYFEFEQGSTEKLVLSDAGKEYYVYCKAMSLTVGDGQYELDATLTDDAVNYGGLPGHAVVTISDVGTAGEIDFPQDLSEQADFYIDGILYGKTDESGKAEVRLVREYATIAVINSEITVGGKTYTVDTLGDEMFSVYAYGYPQLRYIVVPTSVTSVECSFPGSSLLCYCGTAEQYADVIAAGRPFVYFYSETEPTDDGDYWYWKTEGEAAAVWGSDTQ